MISRTPECQAGAAVRAFVLQALKDQMDGGLQHPRVYFLLIGGTGF